MAKSLGVARGQVISGHARSRINTATMFRLQAPQQSIKSADRVFSVLELFAEQRRPLRLKEIVAHLGYPTSSAAALLKVMMSSGYLSFDQSTRTYIPTIKLSQLGEWITETVLDERLLKVMKALLLQTRENVILGQENGIYAQYTKVLSGDQPIRFYVATGAKRLLVHSGMGWALLAERSDDFIEKIYRQTVKLGEISERHFSLAALTQRVVAVRRSGYAYSESNVSPGAGVIAMVIPGFYHDRQLALGIGGPVERLNRRQGEFVAVLKRELAALQPAPPSAGAARSGRGARARTAPG